MAKQDIRVTGSDPVTVIKQILELGAKGATLKPRTFPRLKAPHILVELEMEPNSAIQTSPNVAASFVPLSVKTFNKEQLDEMTWEDFKAAVQSRGVKGRQRDVMLAKYLKAVEDGVEDVGEE